ncbi:MAG: lysylphosphatidylglycerol synthase transmembrane domain-containing protein, partial [Actinomycetes bacterium]
MNRLRQLSKSPLFHIAVWLIPLAAVIWWATKQKAPQWPDTPAEIAWVVGALLVYVVATLLRGERWHRLLHSSEIEVGRGDSYGLTVVGYAGNNVLPARGGELLRVFLLSSRTGAQRRTVVGTILAERLLD